MPDSLDGLKEDITIEIAKKRIIQNPTTLNTSLENFYDYLHQSEDIYSYAGFFPTIRVGITELHGRRDAQEDRVALGLVPAFKDLSETNRSLVLKETVMRLETIIDRNHMNKTGSTLCAIVTDGNHVYTTNVGDSTAYLAVLNAEGKSVQFMRLNKMLHHPTDPSETNRLETAGKKEFIHHQRLMGLALSRSMGDTDLAPYGLIHTPDVYHDEIHLPENGKAFIIVACDGLTEGKCLAENTQEGLISIETLIQKNAERDLQEVAKILSHAAIDQGSSDNISVLITDVETTSVVPTYMAIFDGHGGRECAEILRKNFHSVFVDTINHSLRQQ